MTISFRFISPSRTRLRATAWYCRQVVAPSCRPCGCAAGGGPAFVGAPLSRSTESYGTSGWHPACRPAEVVHARHPGDLWSRHRSHHGSRQRCRSGARSTAAVQDPFELGTGLVGEPSRDCTQQRLSAGLLRFAGTGPAARSSSPLSHPTTRPRSSFSGNRQRRGGGGDGQPRRPSGCTASTRTLDLTRRDQNQRGSRRAEREPVA